MKAKCISIWREQNIRGTDATNHQWLGMAGSLLKVGKDASLCVLLEGGVGHGGAKGILILAARNVDQTNAKRSACEEFYVQDQSLALFLKAKKGFQQRRI